MLVIVESVYTERMKSLVIVGVVLLVAVITSAEQCGQEMKCPKCEEPPKKCNSGYYIRGPPCGCCLVCAKAENESCGGPGGYKGYCALGLHCDATSDLVLGTCKKANKAVAKPTAKGRF